MLIQRPFTSREFLITSNRIYKIFGISKNSNLWVRVRMNRTNNITIEVHGGDAVFTIYKRYCNFRKETFYIIRKLSKTSQSSYILFRNKRTNDGYEFSSIEELLDRFEEYVNSPTRKVKLFSYERE